MKKLDNLKEVKKPDYHYDIGGTIYAISDSMDIEVQSHAGDVYVYGWTLEVRWKHAGDWLPWMTNWNHRIYQSQRSALDAATKIYPSYKGEDYQWRVTPLYKMNVPEYRQYKIDKLLSNKTTLQRESEIKAWKVNEDKQIQFGNGRGVEVKRGEIFLQISMGNIIRVATYTQSTEFGQGYLLRNYLLPMGLAEEIDISEEKWIHPHLCKELKRKLKINK
jgi:hypothetical protein